LKRTVPPARSGGASNAISRTPAIAPLVMRIRRTSAPPPRHGHMNGTIAVTPSGTLNGTSSVVHLPLTSRERG
jgi:hypothetical protein